MDMTQTNNLGHISVNNRQDNMKNVAVLGSLWGDEGKGNITHYLSSKGFNWVIRFGGGANAGHTIYRDGKKWIHNLLPSFDWRIHNIKCFLASGMVIDLEQLYNEIVAVEKFNCDEFNPLSLGWEPGDFAKRIYIDPDAFAVLPQHKEEDQKNNGHIGSTNRGIGPAYKSKVDRCGIRVGDLLKNQDPWAIKLKDLGVQFKYFLELRDYFERQSLLFEGAQGVMLDLNHGCYPYVSCGDSTIAGIYACGFNFVKLDKVYGITKCYTTKVGEGPFPTELSDTDAEELRKLGNEYGATTGRPRRIGWLDLPAMNYACKFGGITNLIITKLDILKSLEEIPVCVAYKKAPVCPADFFNAKPQIITIPGWKNPRDPQAIKPFIDCIKNFTGCDVDYISCGIKESDIIGL